jgi:hypothetical protein
MITYADGTRVIREGAGRRGADALAIDRVPERRRAVRRQAEARGGAGLLGRVRVRRARLLGRAAVAGHEGEVGEAAVLEETLLLVRHAVADVVLDVRGRALEAVEVVEVGDLRRALHPLEQLLIGDDPDCAQNE